MAQSTIPQQVPSSEESHGSTVGAKLESEQQGGCAHACLTTPQMRKSPPSRRPRPRSYAYGVDGEEYYPIQSEFDAAEQGVPLDKEHLYRSLLPLSCLPGGVSGREEADAAAPGKGKALAQEEEPKPNPPANPRRDSQRLGQARETWTRDMESHMATMADGKSNEIHAVLGHVFHSMSTYIQSLEEDAVDAPQPEQHARLIEAFNKQLDRLRTLDAVAQEQRNKVVLKNAELEVRGRNLVKDQQQRQGPRPAVAAPPVPYYNPHQSPNPTLVNGNGGCQGYGYGYAVPPQPAAAPPYAQPWTATPQQSQAWGPQMALQPGMSGPAPWRRSWPMMSRQHQGIQQTPAPVPFPPYPQPPPQAQHAYIPPPPVNQGYYAMTPNVPRGPYPPPPPATPTPPVRAPPPPSPAPAPASTGPQFPVVINGTTYYNKPVQRRVSDTLHVVLDEALDRVVPASEAEESALLGCFRDAAGAGSGSGSGSETQRAEAREEGGEAAVNEDGDGDAAGEEAAGEDAAGEEAAGEDAVGEGAAGEGTAGEGDEEDAAAAAAAAVGMEKGKGKEEAETGRGSPFVWVYGDCRDSPGAWG